jgi:predicted dehydrogenase
MRVGVIGTGHLGREHARVYAGLPGVELVGVHDLEAEAAAAAAARAGCPVFARLEELLDAAQAASICVPTPAHAEVATACLEAGLHVLIEKPITDDPNAARRLEARAARHARVLQVGHIERFNPAMLAAAAHLVAPRFVESHRLAPFGRRGAEVAVVLDLMIHDLDLVLGVVDDAVQAIDAAGVPVLSGSTDIANARLRFRGGCVANVTASRISQERLRKIRFFQPDSYVSVDLLRGRVDMVRKRAGFRPEAFQEALARGETPDLAQAFEPVAVTVGAEEPLQLELAAFVDCARTGARPRVGAAEAIRALEVACEIERLLRAEA